MNTTRRDFLKTTSLLSAGALVPTFLARTALAAPNSSLANGKDTILVVVQLTGGNDGLNTVIPFKNELYAKYRPTLKVPVERIKKIDDSIGLHPSLEGLHGLLDEKALCVVQGVGYPNPSQSHFRSMDIWQAASLKETLTEGWIGKALKAHERSGFSCGRLKRNCSPCADGCSGASPLDRLGRGLSIEDDGGDGNGQEGAEKRHRRGRQDGPTAGSARLRQQDGAERLRFERETSGDRQELPAEVALSGQQRSGQSAETLRQLIDAGLGARIFYVSIDGFDTHANQGGAKALTPTC